MREARFHTTLGGFFGDEWLKRELAVMLKNIAEQNNETGRTQVFIIPATDNPSTNSDVSFILNLLDVTSDMPEVMEKLSVAMFAETKCLDLDETAPNSEKGDPYRKNGIAVIYNIGNNAYKALCSNYVYKGRGDIPYRARTMSIKREGELVNDLQSIALVLSGALKP